MNHLFMIILNESEKDISIINYTRVQMFKIKTYHGILRNK